jgi:hypothetical protein
MDATISAPPAFAVSRKRKRLHLIEDNSPEHQTSQLPSAIGIQSSSSASTSAKRHHRHHSSSPDERDELVEDSSAPTSTTAHHRRRRSSSDMPRAESDGPPGPATLELPSSGLNRGFACMGCRKRKSKCVGLSLSTPFNTIITYSTTFRSSFVVSQMRYEPSIMRTMYQG